MRHLHIVSIVVVLFLMISACGGAPSSEAITDSESLEPELVEFKPNNFNHSANIDNEWLPLQPGRQWIYEGFTTEDGETTPHRIEFTVTDLTKKIEDVNTVVAYIVDYSDGEVVEKTIAFYAQDNHGNVWYLGEHPEEFEDGEFIDAPTWIAGQEEASAGVAMKVQPRLGSPSYFQGWAPTVDWTDYGQVDRMNQQTCVPEDCYGDVLVIAESSLNEPNAFQLKYYARGVGNVRVGWRGDDSTQEELELVDLVQLDPETLAEVRAVALALEEHAYEIRENVYGQTAPAEHTLVAKVPWIPRIETIEKVFDQFDPDNFDDPTNIDNTWLPLQPGTQWVYEGFTIDEDETADHRIEFTVTDLTKEIEGIETVVAWILDYSDDELVEAEIAFYAQDNDGQVWFLGEYPEEYEDGEVVEAPTWIAGVDGARPGLKMQVEPQLETPAYFQGWGPAIGWTDYGQVDQVGVETCVPVECYEDVLVIAESSLDEPNAFQLKYYASGMGNVRVGWRGADATQEELELVEYVQLDSRDMAEARMEALALEKHAYETSPDVYAQTTPMELPAAVQAEIAKALEKIDSTLLDEFDPNNFDQSTTIDNEWLPLRPGTRLIYEGFTVEDDESIPHRLVFTVTDLTKMIEGVETVVAWIVDYEEGDLVEAEIAFYAQDNDGNVWFLGEYPEEYEEGEFIDAPTWIAGVEGARAGLKMNAGPQLDTPAYFQGWAPAVDWSDYGQVDQMGLETCVPEDCYEDVLVIAESSLEEPGAFQLKYYARGVGNVQVGWRGDDATQEELELTEIVQLNPKALERAREEALKLEQSAYQRSKDVYGQTPPAEGP